MNSAWTIPGSAAIWLAIGWSVVGVGLLLLLLALFKDRARGRLRCPKCWYDMSGARAAEVGGAIDLRCPECGHEARTIKRLSKTRRNWRLVAVALLIALLGGAAASVPVVNRGSKDGWWTIAPDWLLVSAVDARGWRMERPSQGSPELEMHSRAVRGELSNGAVRTILGVPASVGLRAPKRWVAGEPLVVRVILSDLACLPRGLTWRVVDPQTGARIRPRQPIIRMISDSLKVHESYSTQDWEFEIPTIADGVGVVTVQALGAPPAGGVIWSRQFPIKLELRPTPDALLDVLEWRHLDSAFELRPGLNTSLQKGNMCGGMRLIDRRPDVAPQSGSGKEIIESTIFAFRIEYLVNGKTVARGRGAWSFAPIDRWFARHDSPIEIIDQDWDRSISESLQVRFTTDRENVPRDWNATHYWSGDITLPARPLFGLPERVSDSSYR